MKTGFSKLCITPPHGVAMCGYYETRAVKGVLDDLYATAVAFDDGNERALILAVDVCLLTTAQANKIKSLVSERTGIDANAIFMNCSHTHTGPVIEADFSGAKGDPAYDAFFYDQLAEVSEKALLDMRESKFSINDGTAPNISFVRRYRMKNGGVQTNPGVGNDNILHVLGEADDTVRFLKIERESAETIVIVNFGTHADTVGGELISGDWTNFVNKTIEDVFENTYSVFLTGAQGDVNHINPFPSEGDRKGLDYNTFDGVPRGYEHAKHMGRKVAAAVIAGFDKTRDIAADKIAFAVKTVTIPSNRENDRLDEARHIVKLHTEGRDNELPFDKMELTTAVAEAKRIIKLENGPESFDFSVTVLKLGDFVLAGLPGECFVEIGKRIKAGFGSDSLVVCCLTNGGDGYFPTSSAHDEGGYEAKSSPLKKGGDNILVENTLSLLGEVCTKA